MEQLQQKKKTHIPKWVKWILWGILSIVLSALGSGFWNFVLYDFLGWLGHGFLSAMSYIFNGYVDTLHKRIGRATLDPFIYGIWLIMPVFSIIGGMVGYHLIKFLDLRRDLRGTTSNEEYSSEKVISSKRKLYMLNNCNFMIYVVLMLMFFNQFILDIYASNACAFVERSIVILTPKLTPDQVLELRAKYRAVNNAEKFYSLEAEIKGLAKTKGIEIPTFDSIKSSRHK